MLKNKRRVHRIIKGLRDDIVVLRADNGRLRDHFMSDHNSDRHLHEQIRTLDQENTELLKVRESYYKLLCIIDVTDKVRSILKED